MLTEREYELLEAIYFRRTRASVDMRHAKWKENLAEYDNLLKLGYVSYFMTGPGDGVYQFTITEAGEEALKSRQ